MSAGLRLVVAGAGLIATLAACQPQGAPPAASSSAAPIALGANLSGEPCRAIARRVARGDDKNRAAFDVFCGSWERPSGAITAVPAPRLTGDSTARRRTIENALRSDPLYAEWSLRLDCKPETWLGEGAGTDYALSQCTLKSGQWPYVTVAAERDGTLFLGEGIPAIAPVLVTAARQGMTAQGGAGTPAAAVDHDALIRQLETSLGGSAAMFGSGALTQFEDLVELARLYNGVENHAGAEQAYRRALDIQTGVLGEAHPGVGETTANLALEISNQGRGDEAELMFQRAEPLIRRSANPADLPRFQSYLALHAANQRQFVRALGVMRDVTRQRRELASQFGGDDTPDPSGSGSARAIIGSAIAMRADLAHGLIFEASMALRVDDVAGAEAAAREARRLIDETRGLPPWWRPRMLSVSGEVNARLGRSQQAERDFADSAALRRSIFGNGWTTASAFFDLGQFRSADGRFAPAVEAYRTGFAMMNTDTQRRPEIRFQRLAAFFDAALALAEQDSAARSALYAEMFRVSQFSREGAASQAIARTSARLASNDPGIADLVRSLQEASRQRDNLRLELSGETSKPRERRDAAVEADLRTRAAAAVQQTEELEGKLQASFPGYAKLAAPRPVEAEEIARRLSPQEAFVSFGFSLESGYAFVVRQSGPVVARLDLSEEDVAEAVGLLRQAFEIRAGRVEPYDLAAAHNLYRRLFGPIETSLQGVTRLYVAPSGALLSLPPSLLVTEAPAAGSSRDYVRAAWLGKRMATAIVPSARGFIDLRDDPRQTKPPKSFIGFGAPNFTGPTVRAAAGSADPLTALGRECRTGAPMPPALLRALAPLPETADEVRRVASLLGAEPDAVVLGRAATEPDVRRRALDQYRVIYFATHGLLPGELRCQSEPGLVLSPPDAASSSPDEDGLLDASAIATLRLAADLVVLSACNTGGGGGKFGGESLSGLAEAFFYAGARSLLVSHWQVPSRSTADLMVRLFEGVAAGEVATVEALRRAQLALAASADTAHPFYWAAFTLIGSGGVPAVAGVVQSRQ